MKFVHVITIEQLPDGDTRLEQSTRKEGAGRPSPQMTAALESFYHAFGAFWSQYKPDTVPGRKRIAP